MTGTPHKAILSLGSNIGDRTDWLNQATQALAALPGTEVTAHSSIYETEPVNVPESFKNETFLNTVVIIKTTLHVEQLSDAIHKIEDYLQRVRTLPNQPRTIDIDIITFDKLVSDDSNLTLPHPRAHLRRFVLQPLSELEPDFILPEHLKTVTELLKALPHSPASKLEPTQYC